MGFLSESVYHYVGKGNLDYIQHTHENAYEIIQVWNDDGHFLINDMSYAMQPGAVFVVDASFFHYSAPKCVSMYKRSKVVFDKMQLRKAAAALGFEAQLDALFCQGGRVIYQTEDKIRETDNCFLRICEKNYANADTLDVAAELLILLRLLAQQEEIVTAPEKELLDKIIHAVNRNLSEQISVEGISRDVFVNKYYLCHYFKEHTGMTLMDYVNIRRVAMAKALLVDTQMPVADIAEKCGYNSSSYFGKKFREVEGMSPVEYRHKRVTSFKT